MLQCLGIRAVLHPNHYIHMPLPSNFSPCIPNIPTYHRFVFPSTNPKVIPTHRPFHRSHSKPKAIQLQRTIFLVFNIDANTMLKRTSCIRTAAVWIKIDTRYQAFLSCKEGKTIKDILIYNHVCTFTYPLGLFCSLL